MPPFHRLAATMSSFVKQWKARFAQLVRTRHRHDQDNAGSGEDCCPLDAEMRGTPPKQAKNPSWLCILKKKLRIKVKKSRKPSSVEADQDQETQSSIKLDQADDSTTPASLNDGETSFTIQNRSRRNRKVCYLPSGIGKQ